MKETTLTVHNAVGLHARPASIFFKKAREFKSKITIQNLNRPEKSAVAISAFNLLQIGVKQGHQIHLRAEGEDEDAALAALTDLVKTNFGEQ